MCQIKFDVTYKAGFGMKHASFLFTVLVLSLASVTIFLGGLASLQNECHDDGAYAGNTNSLAGIAGFSATALSCKKIYRYYWFIASFQYIITGIALFAVLVNGKLDSLRGSLVGLFVVGTLLFIYTSNSFLNLLDVELFQSGTLRDRSKTAVAGAIITATLNALTVVLSGYQS